MAVVAVAFAGAFASDQVWFHLGRARGRRMLLKRPVWHERAQRLTPVLHKHKLAVLLGFRFVLGFRVVTPVILGSLGFSAWKFAAYDFAGALAWALIFCVAGYTFGHAVEQVLGEIQKYEAGILAALVVIGTATWFVRRRRKLARRSARIDATPLAMDNTSSATAPIQPGRVQPGVPDSAPASHPAPGPGNNGP